MAYFRVHGRSPGTASKKPSMSASAIFALIDNDSLTSHSPAIFLLLSAWVVVRIDVVEL